VGPLASWMKVTFPRDTLDQIRKYLPTSLSTRSSWLKTSPLPADEITLLLGQVLHWIQVTASEHFLEIDFVRKGAGLSAGGKLLLSYWGK
jgi:hypothetical protein